MRFRKSAGGITLNVVAGTSAVLFSIDIDQHLQDDLLGFYIRKVNLKNPASAYDVQSSKRFPGTPKSADGRYSTKEHPWQSLLWEDFYVSEQAKYQYFFTPVKGQPGNLVYGEALSVVIDIPSLKSGEHEVHFNRGVAGSQAYAREFGNVRPDEMPDDEKVEALKWLSRGLYEALTGFIGSAEGNGWQLRCCFYEFIYPGVLKALKAARARGVDVQIIYDSRHEADKNDAAITAAGLDRSIFIRRTADPGYLQHNKYMILLKNNQPVAVWTGSTNITEKAIFGHCNVGHIVRNADVAKKYLAHWKGLKNDPVNEDARKNSIDIQKDVDVVDDGMTVFFSPRPATKVLKLYKSLMDSSAQLICGMFPFSFNKGLKSSIIADTEHLKYIIMNTKDKNTTLVTNDVDNVIIYGGKLDSVLYDWAEEKNSGELFYNGVNFIHNKVILIDPLGESPIVITGSANFSDNSVLRNDENTIVIKGNKDVADLYFTEFSRIFNHYAVRQKTTTPATSGASNLGLLKVKWTAWGPQFYAKNALKNKRRLMFSAMKAIQLP
jgi:hypothetical protein